ncbi:MAG: translocation/assembly module TamB domain-containing protein [Pyrinomonadaceae bacterium]
MSEENSEKIEEREEIIDADNSSSEASAPPRKRRRYFSRKTFGFLLAFSAILIVSIAALIFTLFKTGYVDSYVKEQFVTALGDMGITFESETFTLDVSPLSLTLRNATFKNKKNGEKLFNIGMAKFNMTILDLYELKTERNIDVTSTDVNGLEAWVNFDENGKSNFDGIELLSPESSIKFQYASTKLSVKNSIVHFGESTRKISGDAKNVIFLMEPTAKAAAEETQRYTFDFTSTESAFVYDTSRVDPINIRATGIADNTGADVKELRLTSPVGSVTLNGKVEDWRNFKYDLKIYSTVDLAKTSEVFPVGTAITGFGNFEGTVKGEGEKYTINGAITSENLAASNIRLKALKVNASVDGKSAIYDGHGTAVAELLTFEDFIVDYPQLSGNIRGTGTDFKWFGELKAAAAKTPFGTLAGLYISDADAEYQDKKFGANLRDFRAKNFSTSGVEISSLQVLNAKVASENGTTNASVPNAKAGKVDVEGATLEGVDVRNVKVRNRDSQTDVDAADVRIDRLDTSDARLRNVTASSVTVRNKNGATDATAGNVRSDGVDINNGQIGNIDASGVDVKIAGNETKVYSNNVKVAKITTDAAVLGSLNVAGVRLTIREGRIEGTSNDFNAGNIDLPKTGRLEDVSVKKPVFILEPSGRYRASLDMTLGGGMLGSVRLGAARAAVVADNDRIRLNNLAADVMDGRINGDAAIAMNNRTRSEVKADFTDLDISKLLALSGGQVIPIEGKTTGRADLNFFGTSVKRSSGTVTADIVANAGSQDDGLIPVTGKIGVQATDGLFNIDYANLNTAKSELSALGSFDLNGSKSNLDLRVSSTDASEVDRFVRVLNVSETLNQQLDSYQAEFAGNFSLNAKLTGSISDPFIEGKADLDSVILRGRDIGSLASSISVTPTEIELRDGVLRERDGGILAFNINAPRFGANNIAVQAKLDAVDLGSLLSALDIDSIPGSLRDINADTSGDLNLRGLPYDMQGEANLVAKNGSVQGQSFDNLETKVLFAGTLVNVEKFEAKFGDGMLTGSGTYDTNTTAFNFKADGNDVPVSRIIAFFPPNSSVPKIEGFVDLTANAAGTGSDSTSYNINFNGVGSRIIINDNSFGNINFDGKTENRLLTANITAGIRGRDQVINATVNFADPNLPLRAETKFNKAPLSPYLAIFRSPAEDSIEIDGVATGDVFLEGNLSTIDASGKRVFTSEFLKGNAQFSQLDLQIDETPLNATEPIDIQFSMNEVTVSNAKFAGGGSNLVIHGTKAFNDDGINNLSLDGKINLRILNAISNNIFFSGFSDVAMRLTGVNKNSRLNGSASIENASASTFIGSERITFERLQGSMIFTTNQVQIERLTGFLGGGAITATGGASLSNLELSRLRLELQGNNITARLPKDFITTGNANIRINSRRVDGQLNTFISGTFYAKRSVYNKDIDLADLISGRREASLSQGSSNNSVIGVPRLDIQILGRNALHVNNNLANLDASVDLRVTGDVEFPQISGRISATSGTIVFRNDRYEVQRGELTFPPNTGGIEPIINLQAESQISGYQVFVSLSGKLTDSDSLVASLRSNPSLPQADVVSLITTGSLSNSGNGIPTYASSGLNTAAEILTDEIINKPIARATDKLFGLNKFSLDPIISGERTGPTARLTVGRQINRNLLVTYSTNLSEDQNQVLALEYRVSNRLSFVAQYEQRSLSNVTRNRNNFSFEIRLRKRF